MLPARDDTRVIVGKQGVELELYSYSLDKHLPELLFPAAIRSGPWEDQVTKAQALLMSLRKDSVHTAVRGMCQEAGTCTGFQSTEIL